MAAWAKWQPAGKRQANVPNTQTGARSEKAGAGLQVGWTLPSTPKHTTSYMAKDSCGTPSDRFLPGSPSLPPHPGRKLP